MANEHLKRTPTSTGDNKVFTWSGWVKRSIFTANYAGSQNLFRASGGSGGDCGWRFDYTTPNDSLRLFLNGAASGNVQADGKSRDPGNWMHVMVAFNTTLEQDSARVRIYVNGALTPDNNAGYPNKNFQTSFNEIITQYIGAYNGTTEFFNGEMCDVFMVDGQALTPDVFGFYKDGDGYISVGSTQATDFRPGQWMPHSPTKIKKDVNRRGGFGVNGFYLPMNDSSNPGADFHCTPNSIIKLKGEDLPQPQNGAPTTSDAYVSQLRPEVSTLGFDGCLKLDGNQGLSIADTAALDLGTGDFTIEGFYYLKDEGTYHALFDFRGSGGDGLYPALFKDQTENKLYFYENSGVEIDDISMRHNEWMHVAICRNSGVTRAFVDGKLSGSFSDSNNYISRDLYIGQSLSNSNDLFGFVSNFRIVKGTGLYTANFTPPTEPLTAVTNTILLCANSTTSATASTVTPSSISAIGTPTATRNELSGSIVLAVPGISLQTGNLISNGNFENSNAVGWTLTGSDTRSNFTSSQGSVSNVLVAYGTTGGIYQSFTTEVGKTYKVSLDSDGGPSVRIFNGSGVSGTTLLTMNLNNSGGYEVGQTGTFTATSTTSTFAIVDILSGGAVQVDNIGVFDNNTFVVETVKDYSADIKGSGTNRTPTTAGSMGVGYDIPSYYGSAINATGGTPDALYYDLDGTDYGTNDFTFECWFYATEAPSNWGILMKHATNGSWSNGIVLNSMNNAQRRFTIYTYSAGQNYVTPSTFDYELNQWHHVVAERYNNTLTLYVNGVAHATRDVTGHNYSVSGTPASSAQYGLSIGAQSDGNYQSNGYFQDVRIYKGLAKYKGGFDVPKPYTPVGIEAFRTTTDTCKNNFVTMNPLNKNGCTLSNGNLTTADATANGGQIYSTMGSNTGKWYYEAHVTQQGAGAGTLIGINPLIRPSSNAQNRTAYRSSGDVYSDSSTVQTGTTYITGDIIGVAWDADNKKLWFAKNGSWVYSGNPAGGTNPAVTYTNTETQGPFIAYDNGGQSQVTNLNFGQNPSFSGQTTAGTNADGNGKGLFKYAPPTGFLALCEDNLPTPTIADPGKHFKSVLYTGSGDSTAITGVGFQPDLVWVKKRGTAGDHKLIDVVRGSGQVLESNTTDVEGNESINFTGFNSDGFDLGANNAGAWNESAYGYVAWCWKAGGAAVSNTDGALTSQVSVNQTAGFSIATYTTLNAATTFGHGLGKKPAFALFKARNNSGNWAVYHQSLGTNTIRLSTADPEDTNVDAFNSTSPTDTLMYLGTWAGTNGSNVNWVSYLWAEIEGFSKFGSYVGNGDPDGPFVYCGFKPAWVLIKKTNGSGDENWRLFDSSRCPTNQNNKHLLPSSSGGESTETGMDLLSNGFKIRDGDAHENQSGTTYIFASFAESPFKTANAK